MIGGLMFGLKFENTDYLVTALLCLGLIFFTQADAQSTSDFNIIGNIVAMILIAVIVFFIIISKPEKKRNFLDDIVGIC